jgi:hypothetical protein
MRSTKLFFIAVLLLAFTLPAMAQKDTTHTVTAAVRDNARIAVMYSVPPEVLFAFNADKAESLLTVQKLSQVKYPTGAKLFAPRAPRLWQVGAITETLPEWPITFYYKKGRGGYISVSRSLSIQFVSSKDEWGLKYVVYSGGSYGERVDADGYARFVEFWDAIFWAGVRDELPRYIREKM